MPNMEADWWCGQLRETWGSTSREGPPGDLTLSGGVRAPSEEGPPSDSDAAQTHAAHGMRRKRKAEVGETGETVGCRHVYIK